MPQLSSPRRLAFRGHVEAFAWGFPRSLVPPDELPSRVLPLWQSGARLEEFDWGHILFLPKPQKVRAEMAPALVLTRNKNTLVSAPPSRGDDLESGTWIIEDGEWHALRSGQLVDVSLWLDVGSWTVPQTTPLGEVPEVPTVVAPVTLDLRAQSGIQDPDPKWQAIWERGGDSPFNFPLPNFAPSRFFDTLSGWFTPNRDSGGAPIASNRSIVLSGIGVLGSAVLFATQSVSNPQGAAYILPLVVLFSLLLFWLLRRIAMWAGKQPTQHETAPPIVVSPGVQNLSLVFIAIGLFRLFASDISAALSAVFTLVLVVVLSRVLGLAGSLVGKTAVGVGNAVGGRGGNGGESWLSRWLRRRGQDATPGIKTRDNAGDLWRRLMASAAFKSGLFKTLGRAQARYLLRSMEMFERGDLDAALRHAIPLGGKSDGLWSPPPALGLPNARSNFDISLANAAARGTMNFGPEVEERLRALYRRAFEKLRDAGEIHKAAFVLADLLQNAEEAVEFLEKHNELELAAKLAEGRQLAPGLVVRAWWLAGNRKRAVQLAQLREAFADAVVRLEKNAAHREDAAALRLLWGHHLAEQGRYDAAVEAVWPLPQYRPFASKWLRIGLEENVAPRLLARALALEPDSWTEWRPLLETLLQGEQNENGAARRTRFARELHAQKSESSPTLAVAARWTARAVLRDGAHEWAYVEQPVWKSLLSLANDGLLNADSYWPKPLRKGDDLAKRTEPLEISITGEGGTLNARDAVLLENGELLVALGEMGARLLSWDGRVKAQFDVPAHTIVPAFDAPRVLLLAPRDDIWRITKLDINHRKATYWGDVRAICFAKRFDGATWFAASDGRVRAFDIASATPSSLWDSGDMMGQPIELAISRTSLAALVEKAAPTNSFLPAAGGAVQGPAFESWQFELPSLILRLRSTPKFPDFDHLLQRRLNLSRRITSSGEQFALGLEYEQEGAVTASPLFVVNDRRQYTTDFMLKQLFDADTGDSGYTAISWQDDQSALVSLFHQATNKILATLRFEQSKQVAARECEGIWVFWDDIGRVITFNPATSSIERSWILA